ncbi:type III secretion system export apparatus subunit SctT [Halotalea alkalilenta]|uniref:EscT/YscT/HrcT family type III secretion system export apparatus protein n=1 Tax=Halotalea alkalilenta TaxID=376489 RepID=A0A172YHM4_9GAMM|nr:type III secretion system export apparatus subunit SctT [Halotalea alkalilenta]ANF58750.1 EscT/YscT/HrcT family type III secretion system export apparatus protein [Halotalea alkalilenta]
MPFYDQLSQALTELAYPLIASWALAMARALGMIMVTPAFNRLGLTGLIRSAVAATLSLPLVATTFQMLEAGDGLDTLTMTGLLIKEVMIGVMLGLLFGVPFWAAEAAGELIDLQRGSTMAQLLDPMNATESGVTATMLGILMVLLFFISGGFLTLVQGFYYSYQLWPPLAFMPPLSQQGALALLALLDQVMRIAIVMVAPLVVALLIADIMLAYLARMSPNLHVFDLSLSIKNLLFAFLVVLYLIFLVPQLLGELGSVGDNLSHFSMQQPPG